MSHTISDDTVSIVRLCGSGRSLLRDPHPSGIGGKSKARPTWHPQTLRAPASKCIGPAVSKETLQYICPASKEVFKLTAPDLRSIGANSSPKIMYRPLLGNSIKNGYVFSIKTEGIKMDFMLRPWVF